MTLPIWLSISICCNLLINFLLRNWNEKEKRDLVTLLRQDQSRRYYLSKAERSINLLFQELIQKEPSPLLDLENLLLERLFCTTKTLRHSLSIRSTCWRIRMDCSKKICFTQWSQKGKLSERSKLETQWWVALYLKGKPLTIETQSINLSTQRDPKRTFIKT